MAKRTHSLLERLRVRRRVCESDGISDAELLSRFIQNRDEAAFELLVWRHGEMVLGVCRREIRDEQLAEDAFQAVFLVLARKAGAVRGNLAGWLFRVARRVTARARSTRANVLPVVDTAGGPEPDPAECAELSAVLASEVARLPARFRAPVLLCYLGGRSTEDAARELGCPRGTVLSRLAAARKRLAARLTRRGLALPVTLAATGLTPRLVSSAGRAALPFRTGSVPLGPETLLANGVLQTMNRTASLTTLVVVLTATLATSFGWVAAQQGARPGVAAEDPAAPAGTPPRPIEPPANPPTTAPIETTASKRAADDRLRKLEQIEDAYRAAIDKTEARIELGSRLNRKTEARHAELQTQLTPLEAEYRLAKRELDKVEIERSVYKKLLDDMDAGTLVDPLLVESEVTKDATVAAAKLELLRKRNDLELALPRFPDDSPGLKKWKAEVETATKKLEEARNQATTNAIKLLSDSEKVAMRQRLARLDIDAKIKTAIFEKLKAERDALQKLLSESTFPEVDVAALRATVESERELLGRIQREILLLRIQRDGIVLPEASGMDAKLEIILRELAALRKEVQELKAQKK